MAVLTDTNILLRLLQPHHPHSKTAQRALDVLRAQEQILYVTYQNLIEPWAAATRPAAENGLGLSVDRAREEVENIKRLWVLVPDVPLFEEWERLVRAHKVSGKNTHDARLVAAKRIHGIKNILTFDVRDFARRADITVIDRVTLEDA